VLLSNFALAAADVIWYHVR